MSKDKIEVLPLSTHFIRQLSEEDLKALCSLHGIKSRAQKDRTKQLGAIFEDSAETFARSLARLPADRLRALLASEAVRDITRQRRQLASLRYDLAGIATSLRWLSDANVLSLARAVFVQGRLPREISSYEVSPGPAQLPVLDWVLSFLSTDVMHALARGCGLPVEGERPDLQERVRSQVKDKLSELLGALDRTQQEALLLSSITTQIAHRARGSHGFEYDEETLAPALRALSDEALLATAREFLVAGTVPALYQAHEFEIEPELSATEYAQLLASERAAALAEMEQVPHDNRDAPPRALTIKQPWAELIARGLKTIEVRAQPTKLRERIYIFASAAEMDEAASQRAREFGLKEAEMPRGVIVGTVQIVGCLPMVKEDVVKAGFTRDFQPNGEFSWYLARPKRFKRTLLPKNPPQPHFFKPF